MADTEQTWRDRMATASFRGFDFLTENHDAKGGRRLVVHEYPGAEEPLVEDLGGKAWNWKLNAYFIGKDYDLERNGFLAKLAEPGADWLTHPWLGYLWVRAHDWSVHESNDKGGSCTVSIDFVPGGEQPFTAEPDRVDVAIDRTRKMADAVVDDFELEPMSADGMTAFLAAVNQKLEGLRQVISLATLPLTWANQIMGLIAGVKGDLATLMGLPSAYANALRSLSDALGGGSAMAALADAEQTRVVSRIASVATATSTVALSGVAATDGAVRRNLLQEEALRSRLLVTAAAQVAMADYQAEADRDAALASVVTAIDTLLPSLPDPVFQAAVAARAAVIEALLAQDLKPATSRDVTAPLPAVVLAYRLGVDETVFLARNAVRHPLFVIGKVYG
ncbi:MAG TPA: DNA circularization N-terminal domain-containing protein [Rhodocyclaceae bacterium]|jgi:prophage DNA circulation protein|nr:DNA circularization N-terminal domain-containing protein [Rhodocyclaceae bacterium]